MCNLKINLLLFFLFTLFFATSVTQAQEFFSLGNFNSYSTGSLHDQDDWLLTKYYTNEVGEVNIATSSTTTDEKFAEIINEKSLIITKSGIPKDAGTIELKMRHNKVGQFYFYTQTSDNGGQLLFSIQFTPENGIIVEQSNKQITLLPDYNPDQWYSFNIVFDNTRGNNGTFTVSIDGLEYGEYEYVNSESDLFDLAQITFGSESNGGTAVSAFTDVFSDVPTVATSTASDALLQLSISLSSTSISSNLENGLIVTASLDGIAGIATSSVFDTATVTIPSTTTETGDGSSVGSFIMDIIENVIDLFIPEEATTTTPIVTGTIVGTTSEEVILENETDPLVPEEKIPLEEVPSPVIKEEEIPNKIDAESESATIEEIPSNEVITAEF